MPIRAAHFGDVKNGDINAESTAATAVIAQAVDHSCCGSRWKVAIGTEEELTESPALL
jgi:hypothetical protein